MRAADIRGKTDAERAELLQDLYRESFNLRLRQSIGRLPSPSELRRVRRDIARLLTIQSEQRKA